MIQQFEGDMEEGPVKIAGPIHKSLEVLVYGYYDVFPHSGPVITGVFQNDGSIRSRLYLAELEVENLGEHLQCDGVEGLTVIITEKYVVSDY